jgi:hypothetical protein
MTSLNTPEGNLATSPIVINDLNYTSVIIGGFDNSSVALNGDIAELLFFNRLLSDTERKSVESYLYQKYLLGAPPVTEAPVLKISSPPPGIYPAPQTIFLEADESAIVYYTIDGSDPTDESLIYRDSIGVQIPSPVPPDSSRTTTLKFRSYKYGHLPSPVTTLVYTVDQHTTFDRNGLRVWLRSDKVVSSNSSVSQWIDLSGNNNNANQANVSQRPIVVSNQINGNPAIRFDGIDDFLLVPKNASIEPSQLTLVVVSRHTGNGSLQGSFVAKGLSYGIARNNTSTGIAAYINSNTTGLANWSAPEV